MLIIDIDSKTIKNNLDILTKLILVFVSVKMLTNKPKNILKLKVLFI